MAKDDPHFRLRIPADLKDVIEQHARNNQRSINAEIVYALEQFYPKPSENRTGTDLLNMVEEISRRGGPNSKAFAKLADTIRRNIETIPGADELILPGTLKERWDYQKKRIRELEDLVFELRQST